MLERLATKPKRWDGGLSAGEIAARIMGVTEGKSAAAWECCVCYSRNVFSNCVMWIANKISIFLHPAFSGLPDGQMRYQGPSELIEALATKAQRYRYRRHSILLEAKRDST
jgi:hypothetical protein